jgi:hypothetical protein
VDGLFSASAYYHMPTLSVGEYLGIRPRYSDTTSMGGSSFVEAVRQLRGESGDRQVENPNIALVHGNGGVLSSQVTALLGSERAL